MSTGNRRRSETGLVNVDIRRLVDVLRVERTRRDWSRTKLANAMGSTDVDIWRWERYDVVPKSDSLARWARVLGFELTLTMREPGSPIE